MKMKEQEMSLKEQEALNLWLAELMEQKPERKLLSELRQGEDWEYNYAYRESSGGWWGCNIGYDGGEDNELCTWEPAKDFLDDGAASMELLRKLVFQHEIFLSKTLDGQFLIAVDDGDKFNEQLSATAPTLELAIALLAKKLHAEKKRESV